MSHLVFVSYSRVNVKYTADAQLVQQLVTDLRNDLEVNVPLGAGDDACFFDTTNIETGSDWNEDLSEAAGRCRIAVALFSPSYFTSVWCGREFQVFLDRRSLAPPAAGARPPIAIVPVIWIRPPSVPESAGAIQDTDDGVPMASFPPEYRQIGLRQIMLLKQEPQYTQTRLALSARVLRALERQLPEIAKLDLRSYASAWQTPSAPAAGAAKPSVNKACFVYLANDGWDWRPYPEPEPTIGAMAQQITGQIGLRYEEVPYTPDLSVKLEEKSNEQVPTVLISDPSSWSNPEIRRAMQRYDRGYYLNCGLIVPWDVSSPANDARWNDLSVGSIRPQKARVPPPNHDWTSIASPGALKTRTLATVEEIRMRLLKERAASAEGVTRAEDAALTEAANAQGISVHVAPVVANVSKSEGIG